MTMLLDPKQVADLLAVDVTAELGRDANPENRVYRTINGRVIKVRTKEILPPPNWGERVFKMTGSACDETGAALPFGDGHQIARERHVTMRGQLDDPSDLAVQLELHRIRYVFQVQQAAAVYCAELPAGVGTAQAQDPQR
jgi:hypothetical protein